MKPTAPLPKTLLEAMLDGGTDLEKLAHAAGIGSASKLETGLTVEEADDFLTTAWRLLGDPAFGLKAGSVVRPERYGISGLTAMTARDWRGAIDLKGRYNRLIWGDDYELVERDEECLVIARCLDESRPYSAAKIDMEFASLLAFGRYFTRAPITPLWLSLRQPEPAYQGDYLRSFGVMPRFGQPENILCIRRSDALLPLLSANAPAMEALRLTAENQLRQLSETADAGIGGRVRQTMVEALNGSELVLADIAGRLHVSTRTLQRKLADEGLSFSQLFDEVRRGQAEERLRQSRIHAVELAYFLGFADANSFYRAFRRWTGTTPEAYRKNAEAVAG